MILIFHNYKFINHLRMKRFITLILLLIPIASNCQKKELVYLWPGKVPGETKEKQLPVIDTTKKDGVLRYNEITNPALEIWLADASSTKRAALIVCPGGGYGHLTYSKEGTEIAAWLNKLGYSAFVLQYRVPDNRDGALQDAQRAIRIIRSRAAQWNLDANKIGIIGFSAGGDLSVRASLKYNIKTYLPVDKTDSLSCRTNFAMPVYPAYLDMGENRTLTPGLLITKETPPMFLFQAADDGLANSSLVMAGALRDARVPVEYHLVPKGGHGYGMSPGNPAAETWPPLAEKWLASTLAAMKP
jgi:acetyl esterase/lipase